MDLLYSDELNESLLPFDETLSEQLMLGRVIRDISRFALVKVDQGSNSLQIHRLVQAVIRSQMTDEEQEEARHEVHKILAGARPRQGETDDPANWSTYDIIWPHLGPSQAEECDDPRTRQLLIDWVRYQWKHGEFESWPGPGQPAGEPVDATSSGPTTRRPCTCNSRSPTCCAPRAASARPGTWTPTSGAAAGGARSRPSAHPDDGEQPRRRPARAG